MIKNDLGSHILKGNADQLFNYSNYEIYEDVYIEMSNLNIKLLKNKNGY